MGFSSLEKKLSRPTYFFVMNNGICAVWLLINAKPSATFPSKGKTFCRPIFARLGSSPRVHGRSGKSSSSLCLPSVGDTCCTRSHFWGSFHSVDSGRRLITSATNFIPPYCFISVYFLLVWWLIFPGARCTARLSYPPINCVFTIYLMRGIRNVAVGAKFLRWVEEGVDLSFQKEE